MLKNQYKYIIKAINQYLTALKLKTQGNQNYYIIPICTIIPDILKILF